MSSVQIARMAPGTRMLAAWAFIGRTVDVVARPIRVAPDLEETHTGRVVAVTEPPNGNTSALLVLAVDGLTFARAIPLATVIAITPRTLKPAPDATDKQ